MRELITAEMVMPDDEHRVDPWVLNGPRGRGLVAIFTGYTLADYLGDGMHWADAAAAKRARAFKGAEVIYLTKIVIDSPFRGAGHGSKLLAAALAWIDWREAAATFLYVDADRDSTLDNAGLTRWYKRHGFKPVRGSDVLCRVAP